MAYNHWFVSRQKRNLSSILNALVAFSDICVGEVWAGNSELQLRFEDELQERSITAHGTLRARRAGQGGGGTRTLFKQMKDLGLVFTEDDNKLCRLTLIGESIVRGDVTFVDAMRLQLQRYQYPSATSYSGSGSVDHNFRVHPFQFLFRLLRDQRLLNVITMDEMKGIVIHYATSDRNAVFEDVVSRILNYRRNEECGYVEDTPKDKYKEIANTFFNYISLTQYIDRGDGTISIRHGKEEDVESFIEESPRLIPNPELQENYIRRYGRGEARNDTRNFDRQATMTQRQRNETRIRQEYVLLSLRIPITEITTEIVQMISHKTGIDERFVESFLIQTYPHGNIDDFFLGYRNLAHMGRAGATDFELATCEMFRRIFGMTAKHVGQIGNTPDVLVESDEFNFCGIIDNKAYRNGYSISGDHKRVMIDVYIPNYQEYGDTELPLEFFSYIAGSFGANINRQLGEIIDATGVNGSAMPVDLFIDLAQDYAERGFTHEFIKTVFSVNREVRLGDLQ